MSTRFIIAAAVILIALSIVGLQAAPAEVSVSVVQQGGRLGLSIDDPAMAGLSLNMLDAANGGIYFTLPDGTTDHLAKVELDKELDDTHKICYCLTAGGRKANVSIAVEVRRVRLVVLPVGWEADAIKLVWPARADEDFYGGGEVWNGGVNQRGRKLDIRVTNGTPDRCCYVPFYISTRGYGIYADTGEIGTFNFATKQRPDAVEMSFNTRDRQGLTVYYLSGPTPMDLVVNYTGLTGRPPLPPKWSFVPWKWRNEHKNWDEVFEDAVGMREHNIPCSVQWIDNPWMKYGLCSFEFDPERFPDHEKNIVRLKEMGYKVMVWVAPFTNPGVPNYDVALEKGYLVKNPKGEPYKMGGGVYIDLTNPEAWDWWKDEMKKVIRLGISGFKLDRGQDIQEDAVFFDGSTGASMRNAYARLFCQVCYEALNEELGPDFTMLPRAGSAGAQKYSSGHWPGDLAADFSVGNGLGSAIIAGQSIGLAGFAFWGSDIGGFEGSPDKDVFIRWTQFGCFSPIMQLGAKGPNDEPWNPRFGQDGLANYRYYATLHTELLPYTYTYAVLAHQKGLPIMRPLVLEFPDDARARDESFEYLYGSSILVAPVYTEDGRRDIYLPEGEWVDYWNWKGTRRGPTDLKGVQVSLTTIPVFLRNGAIIPMEVENDVTGHGGEYSKGKLTVLALPHGRSHFAMMDGKSTTDFWMLESGDTVKLAWKNARKSLLFRVRMPEALSVNSADGRPYKRCAYKGAYTGKPGTWYLDRDNACVLISPMPGSSDVYISK